MIARRVKRPDLSMRRSAGAVSGSSPGFTSLRSSTARCWRSTTRSSLTHPVPFDRALLYVAEKDVLRTIALEGHELSGHSHGAHKEIKPQGTAAGWAFERYRAAEPSDHELEGSPPAREGGRQKPARLPVGVRLVRMRRGTCRKMFAAVQRFRAERSR
jgi:hypothetical protein